MICLMKGIRVPMCEMSHTLGVRTWFLKKRGKFLEKSVDVGWLVSNPAYMPDETLGQILGELRLKAGMSLREMGEKVGATAPHIRDVEQGNRQPSEALVEKMAVALGVELDELLRYSTRPPAKQMEALIEQDTEYSLAFRKFVDAVRDKNIPPSKILDISKKLPKNP